MSGERVVELTQRITAFGIQPPPGLMSRVSADLGTPETRLAQAARRFKQRGHCAEEARRKLETYNATILDRALSTEAFERIVSLVYPPQPKPDTQTAATWTDPDDRPLPLISYSDVMTVDLPDTEWDVDGIIAREERVIFFGEWSSFKSWVALDLALHLAAGKPWLDKFAVPRPRRVLYVDE
jgi:AAA domain-containing protein